MTTECALWAVCDHCLAPSSSQVGGNGSTRTELNHELREIGWHRNANNHLCDDCWNDGIRFKDLEP